MSVEILIAGDAVKDGVNGMAAVAFGIAAIIGQSFRSGVRPTDRELQTMLRLAAMIERDAKATIAKHDALLEMVKGPSSTD